MEDEENLRIYTNDDIEILWRFIRRDGNELQKCVHQILCLNERTLISYCGGVSGFMYKHRIFVYKMLFSVQILMFPTSVQYWMDFVLIHT